MKSVFNRISSKNMIEISLNSDASTATPQMLVESRQQHEVTDPCDASILFLIVLSTGTHTRQ